MCVGGKNKSLSNLCVHVLSRIIGWYLNRRKRELHISLHNEERCRIKGHEESASCKLLCVWMFCFLYIGHSRYGTMIYNSRALLLASLCTWLRRCMINWLIQAVLASPNKFYALVISDINNYPLRCLEKLRRDAPLLSHRYVWAAKAAVHPIGRLFACESCLRNPFSLLLAIYLSIVWVQSFCCPTEDLRQRMFRVRPLHYLEQYKMSNYPPGHLTNTGDNKILWANTDVLPH